MTPYMNYVKPKVVDLSTQPRKGLGLVDCETGSSANGCATGQAAEGFCNVGSGGNPDE